MTLPAAQQPPEAAAGGWDSTGMLLGGLLWDAPGWAPIAPGSLQVPGKLPSICDSSQELAGVQPQGKAYPVGRETPEDRRPPQHCLMKLIALRNDAWVAPAGTLSMAYSPPRGLLGPNPCSSRALRCQAALSGVECPLTPLRGSGMFPHLCCKQSMGRGDGDTESLSSSPSTCVSLPRWKVVY